MINRNIVKLFASRKSNLDYRLKRDYIRNGIATIPCRISDYHDVIHSYSVKEYETLNPEFVDYLKSAAEVVPHEFPLVLNIVGDCLSQEEKKTIEEVIADQFAYDLGIVERNEKRHKHIFCGMFCGLVVLVIILWLMQMRAQSPPELFFVLFYFIGETVCDYTFLTGHDLRMARKLAGRLASIKVLFSENFEEPVYTEKDARKLYSEIEKDVKKSKSGC